jgi:hypothetical protein
LDYILGTRAIGGKPSSPFKYNSGWGNVEEFKKLVISTWVPFSAKKGLIASENFVRNLHKLKKEVMAWARTNCQSNERYLKMEEKDLEKLYARAKEGDLATSNET